MNKIAAYETALAEIEQEKRASALVESYGTMDGYMPEGYLQAFDEIEKEAGVAQALGQKVTGGIYRLGRAISGGAAGQSGARTGFGGKMMDWASGLGGGANSGAANAARNAAAKLNPAADFDKARESAQRIVGGLAAGATGAGVLGAGFVGGRMTAPRQQR
jgi:hypothetical protein